MRKILGPGATLFVKKENNIPGPVQLEKVIYHQKFKFDFYSLQPKSFFVAGVLTKVK